MIAKSIWTSHRLLRSSHKNIMPENLVIATHNAHKTEEMRAMLKDRYAEIADLSDYPQIPEAVEDGTTFEENANIKAVAASWELSDTFVLADDSGLEVDVLKGEPGVYSARYSGENATDATNRARLLEELEKLGERGNKPTARFRCVLSLAKNGEVLGNFQGAVEGHIAAEESGDGGFGYDSIFVPDGYEETFAELPPEVKQAISHRARAVEAFQNN